MTTQPSIDGTRLPDDRYLEVLDADVEAILAASQDLAAAVPGCPGWTVRDLLSHVIGVYRHKVVALDLGEQPPQRAFGDWGELAVDEDPREVLGTEYAALRERLTARDALTPTWAWWPTEQTLGFWIRRMAHETAVHRWDAESAVHGLDGAAPIPDDVATDGVDELLGWLRWEWGDERQDDADGQTVLVSTADHSSPSSRRSSPWPEAAPTAPRSSRAHRRACCCTCGDVPATTVSRPWATPPRCGCCANGSPWRRAECRTPGTSYAPTCGPGCSTPTRSCARSRPAVVVARRSTGAAPSGVRLQVTTYDERQAYAANHDESTAGDAVDALLAQGFGNWHVETATEVLQVRITKKGDAQVHRSSRDVVAAAAPESHDR